MEWILQARWSPYIVGAGIGILSCLTFLLSGRAIGCSTAFARTSGMLEQAVRGRKAAERPYFRQFAPRVDWEWILVVGVAVGAWLSAMLAGTFAWRWVPDGWAAAVGANAAVRWLFALLGGMVMGFGARWAGGCTSGHGISGTLQLALSSWIAAICFFIGGVATAMLLFRVVFV